MKYPVVCLTLLCTGALQAAPPAAPDLRQALQQYHPGSVAPPRQLSAEERVELRRQLAESAGRRPTSAVDGRYPIKKRMEFP
jgi:hypothetical protein